MAKARIRYGALAASGVAACLSAAGAWGIPPELDDVPGMDSERRNAATGSRRVERGGERGGASSPKPTDGDGGGSRAAEGAGPGASTGSGASGNVAVPYPHPMISEVLYAVPTGQDGDADRDGTRDSAGDEFVEIVNPHGLPIALSGYMLTDGTDGDSKFRFVFPPLSLEPGDVVVVFNGFKATTDAGGKRASAGTPTRDERFHSAYVLSARVERRGVAFSNEGDMVLLSAPDGTAVHRVAWGTMAKPGKTQAAALLSDVATEVRAGSVQRRGVSALPESGFAEHRTLGTPTPSNLMSPGWYVVAASPAGSAVPTPSPAPSPARPSGDDVVPGEPEPRVGEDERKREEGR